MAEDFGRTIITWSDNATITNSVESASEPAQLEEQTEENIFISNPIKTEKEEKKEPKKIDLDTYYDVAGAALWLNDFTEAKSKIAGDIASQLGINVEDEEFDEAMNQLYEDNKDNFNIYAKSRNIELSDSMETQEILETLVRMSCDYICEDDDIILNYDSSLTNKPEETVPAETQTAETPAETQTAETQTKETEPKEIETYTEELSVYDASKGKVVQGDINMDDYCYMSGKYEGSYGKAKEALALKIAEQYSISENDPKKGEKLEQAYDDIISKNNVNVGDNQEKLDAILNIGNDGAYNDLIIITKHEKNESTADISTKRTYNKETGEIISDETENEYILYSEDESGNQVKTYYTSKEDADNKQPPIKTVSYDKNGEIISEGTADSISEYSTTENGHRIKETYKKTEDGKSDVPYITEEYDENGEIVREETAYFASEYSTTENGHRIKETYKKTEDGKSDVPYKAEEYDENGQMIKYTNYNEQGEKTATLSNNFTNKTRTLELFHGKDNEYKFETYKDYDMDGIIDETVRTKQDGTRSYTFDNIDHKIDYTAQGCINDCWHLAPDAAIPDNEKGEKLSEERFSVKEDENGNKIYTVHYKGLGIDIDVTEEDLAKAREATTRKVINPDSNNEVTQFLNTYSLGDNTALLLEVGLNKLIHYMADNPDSYDAGKLEEYAPSILDMINNVKPEQTDYINDIVVDGALLDDFLYPYFGKTSNIVIDSYIENAIKNLDLENSIANISFKNELSIDSSGNTKPETTMIIQDIDGNEYSLCINHAYGIVNKDIEKGLISIVNPRSNKEVHTFDINELCTLFPHTCLQYYKI